MSWLVSVVLLCLSLLTSRSSATEEALFWWYNQNPVAGVLRVYDLNNDLFPAATRSHRGHDRPLSLIEASASVIETRLHVDGAGATAKTNSTGAVATNLTDATAANFTVATDTAKVITNSTLVANNSVVAAVNIRGKDNTKQAPIAAIGWIAWIRLSMSLGFVVKSACMLTNIFYQASPLPLISDFKAKGDTADADLAPYIALAYSGWQWCFYGLFAYIVTGKSGFLVLVYSNVCGAILGIYYVYAFTSVSKNFKMLEKSPRYYYMLACIVAVQAVAIVTQQPVRALFFSGLISSAWSTITSCSLLTTVPTVYATKNSSSLPLPLLVVGFVSAILWIVCGILLWDPWITFPNAISMSVCAFALYLCQKFPAKSVDFDPSPNAVHVEDDHAACSNPDVERQQSPLQRALGLIGRPSSEALLLQEPNGRPVSYGAAGTTGGTGDSF
jgi:MtN3 and saliva related transmembrane protein